MIKAIKRFIWKKIKEPLAWRRYMKYREGVCLYIWEHKPVWDGVGYHCPKCGLIFKSTGEDIGDGEKPVWEGLTYNGKLITSDKEYDALPDYMKAINNKRNEMSKVRKAQSNNK